MLYNNILETIGNTPLVKLNKITDKNIFVKVESFNPAGSIKDRAAYNMLSNALKENAVNKDTVIIEPTSGNTGVGLCMTAAYLGLKIIIVMPETMSEERKQLMKAYGAELVLTDGASGMKGAINKANELHNEIKNSFIPQQFANKYNPEIHYKTTSEEILKDLNGKIDYFIAGIGTGGTITGIGKKLKEKIPDVKIIGVEPYSSPFLTKGETGAHKIQGIGAGFKPEILDLNIIDEIITVKNEDAFLYTRMLAQKEGILAGISSGANVWASIKTASEHSDKNIVTILPDTGERYLSTGVFG